VNLSHYSCTHPASMQTTSPFPPAVVVTLFGGDTTLEDRSDDELVLLARGGRREAFDTLVRRHQANVLRVAGRYLGDAAAARDAAQNAFLELYRSLGSYRPQGRFPAYLSCLVLNQCRMLGRSSRIRRRASERFAVEPVTAPPLPDEALLAREHRKDVQRAVDGLNVRLREVIVLRYAAGHSLEQVAEILDLPVGTVKSRLFTALGDLRAFVGGNP
jgi:RNA polymerase sigma-70 factor, ECF subfamily